MCGESVVYDEPADWIVEQASHQGATLSRRQLADWHRAGLIAEPRRKFYGGSKGSMTIYPSGTLRQAIEGSVLMECFGSVDHVGWELWMRGFRVAERLWREPLREAHEMFRLFLSSSANGEVGDEDDGGPELSDEVDRLVETVGERLEAPPRMGVARRRLRRSGFKEVLTMVTSAAIGAFNAGGYVGDESGGPARVLSRLLGTEPGRHKASIPSSPLLEVTGQAVAENLEAMAKFLPRIASSISPDDISEREFASARDEVRFLVQAYLSVRQNEARIAPGSTPDAELIKQLLGNLPPTEQAMLFLSWLGVREGTGWRETLSSLRRGVTAGLSEKK